MVRHERVPFIKLIGLEQAHGIEAEGAGRACDVAPVGLIGAGWDEVALFGTAPVDPGQLEAPARIVDDPPPLRP